MGACAFVPCAVFGQGGEDTVPPEASAQYLNHIFEPDDIFTNDIYQDRYGHIWVPANYGLRRYDGSRWYEYFHTGDSSSISDNNTQVVFEDSRGRLWIGTRNNGIDLYDRENDQLIRNADPIRNDIRVWSFHEENDSTIWIGVVGHLIRYNLNKNACEYIPLPKVVGGQNEVRTILPQTPDKKKFWLATMYGLYSYDTRTGEFDHFPHPPDWERPDVNDDAMLLKNLVHDPIENTLWSGTWGKGLVVYNIDQRSWDNYLFEPNAEGNRWEQVVHTVKRRDENSLWIASSNGVAAFDLRLRKMQMLPVGGAHQIADAWSHCGIARLTTGRMAFAGVGKL